MERQVLYRIVVKNFDNRWLSYWYNDESEYQHALLDFKMRWRCVIVEHGPIAVTYEEPCQEEV